MYVKIEQIQYPLGIFHCWLLPNSSEIQKRYFPHMNHIVAIQEKKIDYKKSILMKEYKFNTIFIIFTTALIVCDFIYFTSKLLLLSPRRSSREDKKSKTIKFAKNQFRMCKMLNLTSILLFGSKNELNRHHMHLCMLNIVSMHKLNRKIRIVSLSIF